MPHNQKHRRHKHPFVILGVLILAWLLVPTALKRFTRATFFEFQAPFETGASYTHDLQTFWSLNTRSKSDLIAAGKQLAQLNAAYELRLQTDDALRSEIKRFESLLNLPTPPGYRAEPARVVSRENATWWRQIVIRKGLNYGITVGSPVVFAGGVVGRVSDVHAYTATVDLLSNPRLRLAAMLSDDTRPFSYQGADTSAFLPPKGTAEYIPANISTSSGNPRTVVTSGLGGIFPRGLTIGHLVKLTPVGDGLFQDGEIKLDPALSRLSEVTVLVPVDNNIPDKEKSP